MFLRVLTDLTRYGLKNSFLQTTLDRLRVSQYFYQLQESLPSFPQTMTPFFQNVPTIHCFQLPRFLIAAKESTFSSPLHGLIYRCFLAPAKGQRIPDIYPQKHRNLQIKATVQNRINSLKVSDIQ